MPVSQSYIDDASSQVDPSYNSKVAAAKNNLASQLLNLNQSKTGINSNYDTQVSNQNMNNVKTKNNYSNTMLGRNMGTSSIVGSGLAEEDNINGRAVNQINTARTGDLNNVDQQKALLQNNLSGTLTSMSGDRETQIQALARQLQQQDLDNQYKNNELDLSRQQAAQQAAYQNSELGISQQNANSQQAYYNALAKQYGGDSANYANQVAGINKNVDDQSVSNDSKEANLNDYIKTYNGTNNSDYVKAVQYAKQQLTKIQSDRAAMAKILNPRIGQ